MGARQFRGIAPRKIIANGCTNNHRTPVFFGLSPPAAESSEPSGILHGMTTIVPPSAKYAAARLTAGFVIPDTAQPVLVADLPSATHWSVGMTIPKPTMPDCIFSRGRTASIPRSDRPAGFRRGDRVPFGKRRNAKPAGGSSYSDMSSFLRMNSSAKAAVPSIPSTDESMQRW